MKIKKIKTDDEEEKTLETKNKIDSSKIIVYNYKPSDDFTLSSFETISPKFKIFNSKNHSDIEEEDKMVISFSGNNKIDTNIRRYWFHKYKKYKIKYMELKKKLTK